MNRKLLKRFKNQEVIISLGEKGRSPEREKQVNYLKEIMQTLGYSIPRGDSIYYFLRSGSWEATSNPGYLPRPLSSYEIVTPEDFFTETPKSSEVSNYSVF